MKVCSLDHRQNIEMKLTHPFECQMQSLICVNVWNMASFHQAFQWLPFSSIDKGALKDFLIQDSEEVILVGHLPDSELSRACLFNGILNTNLCGEYLRSTFHHLCYCAAPAFVASAVARPMNDILKRQCLVDRLLPKSGTDEA